jgi:Type IV secretion system proteins
LGFPGRQGGVLMRNALLACAASLWVMASAHAQVVAIPGQGALDQGANAAAGGVGAPVVCTNCETLLHSLLNDAAVAANWLTQLERMTAQLQEQILIFQQLSGLTNVNAMAGVLNQGNMFNQMNSFGNVAAQLQGEGGIGAGYQAANGNLLPVGSTIPIVNLTNAVFNQRATSLANIQGISAQLLANSNVILTGLMTLQHLIDGQPSSQLMGGMNARLASYQGNINSQQYQLAQMQSFANAQDKVFEQKVQQAGYCADLDLVNATASLTGAGAVAGAAHCAVGAVGAVPVAGAAPVAAPAADTAGFDTPLPVPPIPPTAVVAAN